MKLLFSFAIIVAMETNEEPLPTDKENPQTESSKDKLLRRMKPKALKDILVYLVSALIILGLALGSFLARPTGDGNTHVEIKYINTLLYEPGDSSKNTSIAFPKEGEKRITFTDKDGEDYLGAGNDFSFLGGSITITLYSDKSIQILSSDVSCPDHLCSNMGRIYTTYTPLVCLPNHITAMIVADGLPDYDA